MSLWQNERESDPVNIGTGGWVLVDTLDVRAAEHAYCVMPVAIATLTGVKVTGAAQLGGDHVDIEEETGMSKTAGSKVEIRVRTEGVAEIKIYAQGNSGCTVHVQSHQSP